MRKCRELGRRTKKGNEIGLVCLLRMKLRSAEVARSRKAHEGVKKGKRD